MGQPGVFYRSHQVLHSCVRVFCLPRAPLSPPRPHHSQGNQRDSSRSLGPWSVAQDPSLESLEVCDPRRLLLARSRPTFSTSPLLSSNDSLTIPALLSKTNREKPLPPKRFHHQHLAWFQLIGIECLQLKAVFTALLANPLHSGFVLFYDDVTCLSSHSELGAELGRELRPTDSRGPSTCYGAWLSKPRAAQ